MTTANPLKNLLPSGIGNLFELMDVAEEEIKKAMRRYPKRKDAVNKAFAILAPTGDMPLMDSALYRHHAAELLDRVGRASIQGAELGTAAEALMAIYHASLHAPLKRDAQVLYERLFHEIFPQALGEITSDLRESYAGASSQWEAEIRKKGADPARKAFIKETVKGAPQPLFEAA